MVFGEMRAAVEAAALDRLGEVAAAVWKAYGAGGLTDAEAETLDGLMTTRRGAAQAAPVKVHTLAAASAQLATACTPAPGGQGAAAPAPGRAPHRTGSRARSPESLARRRRMAAGGYLPPAVALAFTPGEQAVLAVVAIEVGKRGKCTLAVGHIAALAGVGETTVRRAFAQARLRGLVDVVERRLSRTRNDTNVVTIANREWTAWLRLRLPRSGLVGVRSPGCQLEKPTNIGSLSGHSTAREQAEHRRPTGWQRTTLPPARAVGV